MKNIFLMICGLLLFNFSAIAQQKKSVIGKVLDEDKNPLIGAIVRSLDQSVSTAEDGTFKLDLRKGVATISISYVGYVKQEFDVNVVEAMKPLIFTLKSSLTSLQEVEISTGYQKMPKERATGSFEFVGKESLNRIVSTNIVDRLQNVVSGLVFNKDQSVVNGTSPISIRGQNTIFANAKPLIVIDNFPYEGDLLNINPNDVESITILKDAAAASIWGARAGNGVIVITTKAGRYNQALTVNFNANLTSSTKPNLSYLPKMTSAEVIEVEKQLFDKGYYNDKELAASNIALSPIVELLIAKRDGKLNATEVDNELVKYASLDNRSQISKYLYRNIFNKQYALSLNGGAVNNNYFISAGYDQNATILKGNDYSRFTLNLNHNYSLLNGKLELTTGFLFTKSTAQSNNPGTSNLNIDGIYLPYIMLADEQGKSLSIARYRQAFSDLSFTKGLLDWNYNSLDELATANDKTSSLDYRLSTALKYRFSKVFNLNVNYQYGQMDADRDNMQSLASYYVRDQINRLTIVNPDGTLLRPIPLGGILDQYSSTSRTHNLRAQFNLNKNWQNHSLSSIAGWEIREQINQTAVTKRYGYDEEHAISKVVDYVRSDFPLYYFPGANGNILNGDNQTYLIDRYRSWFGNFSYSYLNRYLFSASARLDQSNLFGVNANQKGVPLYSIGASWDIGKEAFYKFKWVPNLKLRLTYGYNGNIDKSLSAYTTARYTGPAVSTNLPFAMILNPPNPSLRWERVRIINGGIDFASAGNRISGSIEYYYKNGLDLIGEAPYAPATGISAFKGNTANTAGKGIDLTVNTININGSFSWQTTGLFSFINDKVSKYLLKSPTISYQVPVVGKPIQAVYAFPWAGLDPQNGDPQGYLNGALSKDYGALLLNANEENMVYMGSLRPRYFGALRNTFSYAGFELSANISYRLGYVFRRNSIRYTSTTTGVIDNGLSSGSGDYGLRWQKPGDELLTNVPSLSAISTIDRDNFYASSAALVEKADHIRFEDVTLSYATKGIKGLKKPFNTLTFYLNARDLGLLWKKTKTNLDPDYATSTYAPVETLAAGIKMNL